MGTSYPFFEPFTPREVDILQGMVEGLSNAKIAAKFVLSTDTVKWYVKQLYAKLGAHTREEAVSQALALGLASASHIASQPHIDSTISCPLINPLPQDVSDRYVGNTDKLKDLTSLIEHHARLISIHGRAGSGKTALACKALSELRKNHQISPHLSGIVCLTATNTGITLEQLFADLGRLLPKEDESVLVAVSQNNELVLSQKIGILLEKITTKRIILLIDNLETMQNVETGELNDPNLQQFLEMSIMQSSSLSFMITSRVPLQLPHKVKTWEHLISLEDGLPSEDAITLLRRFDPSGIAGLLDAPEETLEEVAGKLGGFPRALESIAGMLLEDPLLRIVDVQQKVDQLEGEINTAVVAQALAHLNKESFQILGVLAVFGQPVRYEALSFLLTPYMDTSTLHTLLGRLIRACFVKSNRATQQFSLHSIDQVYCYEQIPVGSLTEENSEPIPFNRITLHRRAAQYYRGLRSPRSAWRKLADLEPQLKEFTHLGKAGDGDEAARVLLEIDRDYLWEWEYKELLRQLYPTLAGMVTDPHLVMQVARREAWLHFFDGTDRSEQEFRKLLEEAHRKGFVKEEADALDDLAQIFRRGNTNAQKAIELHQQALALYRQIGDRRGEADALGGLGAVFASFEPEEAIDYFIAAADIHRELGTESSLSFVMSMLGSAYQNLGALEQARNSLEEAVKIARQNNSLEALARAYGRLSSLYLLTGESDRVNPLLEETIAITRELTGLPITGQLMFYMGQAALYKALSNDTPGAIHLMERSIREAAAVQPQLVPFGNFFLSLVLTLAGDFPQARKLLPSEALLAQGVGNAYWIGVLLIKVGETENATEFLNQVLTLSQHENHIGHSADYLEKSSLPIRALALAGLALIKQNPVISSDAAELTHQMVGIPNWQMTLHRALIDLLIQEPGGEILLPIRTILDSMVRAA